MSKQTPPSVHEGPNIVIIAAAIGAIATIIGAVITILPPLLKSEPVAPVSTTLASTPIPPATVAAVNSNPAVTTASEPVQAATVAPSGPTDIEPTSVVLPTAGPSPVPTLAALFIDDFSDNHNEWALSGGTRLSQGKLMVTIGHGEQQWFQIPELRVGPAFYIQAQLTLVEGHNCYSPMGFALGDELGNNHRFLIKGECGAVDRVAFYNNDALLFSTPLKEIVQQGRTILIGLEALNGKYTVYVDGEPTESAEIQPYGGVIGLFVWRTADGFYPRESTFAIDSLIVRESK